MKINIAEGLCFARKKFNNKEDALSYISDELFKGGYVKEGFKKNLLLREKKFPTGLDSEGVRVAIPHTDSEYVNQPTLSIMTLLEGVTFKSMGDPDKDLDIEIIIVMALDTADSQLAMLKKIIELVQNKSLKEKLLNKHEQHELFYFFNKIINTEE